jgi:ribosome-binding ATPase YchF (GTP1/OBG family)
MVKEGKSMKIGIVGYKNSGKSLLFQWLTGEKADPAMAHTLQSAMTPIPESRIAELCGIYKPKKVTYASVEIVDTPGLSRDQVGNAARLAQLREVGCLICVVPAFETADPEKEIRTFHEDLILADLELVSNRVERIREQKKRPLAKADQEKLAFELETLEMVQNALESGKPLREDELTPEQQKATRAFRLLSEKPRLLFFNAADDETDFAPFQKFATETCPVLAASVRLENELMEMTDGEKTAFLDEMGLAASDRDAILKAVLSISGQMLFLTAGEKEVRSWLVRKNGTAVEAAAEIHTDIAKGFIRAEIMRCEDIVRLGSERAVKAENLIRREPKDYVLQEGDVVLFHFSG